MEHQEVVERHLVEQYLLREMPSQSVEAFEEHVFNCQECAADLKATAAFLQTARIELEKPTVKAAVHPPVERGRVLSWKRMAPFYALAASLLVILYQNAVVYPRLTSEVARLRAPEVMATVSLVGGNSRGGGLPSVATREGQSVQLLVDVPTQDRFLSYYCQVYSPSQELLATVQVSALEAKDTVHIRIPAVKRVEGIYSLQIQGNSVSNAGVRLAQYSFVLKFGPDR
jgi:hypothetical protein